MRWIVWILAAVMLSGCAAAPQTKDPGEAAVLLSVNGREISAEGYLYWLDLALGTWTQMPDEAACSRIRAQALADTVLYAAVEDMAAEYGVTLLPDEILSVRQAAERTELLYQKLCALNYPEAELRAFAAEKGCRTVERVLIPAGEGAGERAAEVFARLNGGGEEALVDVKRSYSDAHSPYTLLPGEGVLSKELEEAALALDPGEYSGILETEEGFSVLYCLETNPAVLVMPWVDDCLLQRVKAAKVQLYQGYEAVDCYARFRFVCGNPA